MSALHVGPTSIILAIVIAIGTYFRLQMPIRHYLFHDEDAFLHYAQMINQTGIPRDCTFGVFKQDRLNCLEATQAVGGISLKSGYKVLLAVLFRFFGERNEMAAYMFNMILGILSIPVVYIIGRKLWSEHAGMAAASLLAIFPGHIWWSVTTSAEVPALFFLLVALMIFLQFIETREYNLFVLSLLISSYAAFIRPELTVILPIFMIYVFFRKNLKVLIWQKWRNIFLAFLVSVFVSLNFISLITNRYDYWVLRQEKSVLPMYSWEYFKRNIADIISYHITIRDIDLIPILALIGIIMLANKSKKLFLIVFSIFLLLFGFHTFFYYGDYTLLYPLSLRFALGWFLILIIFAGIGFDSIISALAGNMNKYKSIKIHIIILLMLANLSLFLQPNLNRKIPVDYIKPLREELQAKLLFQKANPDCLYVDDVPTTDIYHGYNAIEHRSFYIRVSKAEKFLQQYPCIILFETQSCNDDKYCDKIKTFGNWRELAYSGIKTWSLALNTDQVETGINIPSATSSTYYTKSTLEILGDNIRSFSVFNNSLNYK